MIRVIRKNGDLLLKVDSLEIAYRKTETVLNHEFKLCGIIKLSFKKCHYKYQVQR